MKLSTTADQRLIAIARLAENAASLVTATLDHIRGELDCADGYSHGGAGDDGSRPTSTDSTVEAAMMVRQHFHNQRDQIRDDITALASILDSLMSTCRHTIGTRTPRPQAARCYSDPGLAGYLEWVDPTCQELSRSASGGMCDACRTRARRWRAAHNEPALSDERVIEYDPIIMPGQRGTVHAYVKGA